jgi:hypothetical protein
MGYAIFESVAVATTGGPGVLYVTHGNHPEVDVAQPHIIGGLLHNSAGSMHIFVDVAS